MERVRPDEVPPPYDRLLVHTHHMTVTVEKHHGDRVDVRILDRRHEGDSYALKILLALQGSGLSFNISLVVQALIVLFLLLGQALARYRLTAATRSPAPTAAKSEIYKGSPR